MILLDITIPGTAHQLHHNNIIQDNIQLHSNDTFLERIHEENCAVLV